MSELAWQILKLLLERDALGIWRGYIASWTLGELLGQDAATIQGANVKYGTGNKYERALHELVSKGLVEEMPDLPERWKLVVKGA